MKHKNLLHNTFRVSFVLMIVFVMNMISNRTMNNNDYQFVSLLSLTLDITIFFYYYYYLSKLRLALLPEVFKRKQKKIAFIAFFLISIIVFVSELFKTIVLNSEIMWSKFILFGFGYSILVIVFVNGFSSLCKNPK